jgi:hypothetical protein
MSTAFHSFTLTDVAFKCALRTFADGAKPVDKILIRQQGISKHPRKHSFASRPSRWT